MATFAVGTRVTLATRVGLPGEWRDLFVTVCVIAVHTARPRFKPFRNRSEAVGDRTDENRKAYLRRKAACLAESRCVACERGHAGGALRCPGCARAHADRCRARYRALAAAAADVRRALGGTVTDRTLSATPRGAALSTRDVARSAGVTTGQANKVLNRLKAAGLVELVVASRGRRPSWWRLRCGTGKGVGRG